MSLVAYGSSEESEEELASTEVSPIIPKSYGDSYRKRSRESVKIIIPSLKEFEEEESDKVPEKKTKLQSGTGLFSLLPPPKNATTLSKPGFVPYVLKSKKEAITSSVKPNNASVKKSNTLKKSDTQNISASVPVEHDSDDDVSYETDQSSGKSINFFSLDDSKDLTSDKSAYSNYLPTDIASTSLENDKLLIHQSYEFPSPSSASSEIDARFVQRDSSGLPSGNYLQQPLLQKELEDSPYSQMHQGTDVNYQQSSSEYYPLSSNESDAKETLLKDEGFLKLQGRKRDLQSIDIIEVNASDQLTNKNEWLMKSLTEESTHRPSRKKHNMPTQQQKRKHQITYLAFQAKEREMDLKNQWGLNNRTRRETQAKYGF